MWYDEIIINMFNGYIGVLYNRSGWKSRKFKNMFRWFLWLIGIRSICEILCGVKNIVCLWWFRRNVYWNDWNENRNIICEIKLLVIR